MITRFAPSPTGDLHLGGALCALASKDLAGTSGRYLVRIEDLDPPRVLAGSEERILEDLAWLGLDGERTEPQSRRSARYREAIEALENAGLVYPCDCSRQDIARIASAPHPGEEIPYPGTCRDRDPKRSFKRSPALRFRAPIDPIVWDDLVMGSQSGSPAIAGDFVLVRGDGVFSYQLAVAIDDSSMGITDVVRGQDLVSSTPRQIAILRALAMDVPRYGHLPLVCATDGSRLSKRTPGAIVRDLRARGIAASDVIDVLRASLGSSLRNATELRVPARFC